MTRRSQLIAFRLLAKLSVLAAVLAITFNSKVPNAAELALESGWFVVIGNFVGTIGIVVVCLTALVWTAVSLIVFPLLKPALRLTVTGTWIVLVLEWIGRRTTPPSHVPPRRYRLPDDSYAAPLIGDFMQPENSLRDNLCILAQIAAFPIALMLVIFVKNISDWLF